MPAAICSACNYSFHFDAGAKATDRIYVLCLYADQPMHEKCLYPNIPADVVPEHQREIHQKLVAKEGPKDESRNPD